MLMLSGKLRKGEAHELDSCARGVIPRYRNWDFSCLVCTRSQGNEPKGSFVVGLRLNGWSGNGSVSISLTFPNVRNLVLSHGAADRFLLSFGDRYRLLRLRPQQAKTNSHQNFKLR